jgi:hypothetical protein
MGRRAKHNWPLLRVEYVTGHLPSYQALSDRYHVPLRLIERRGRKEGWVQERKVGAEGVLKRALDGILDQDADALRKILAAKMMIGSRLLKLGGDVFRPDRKDEEGRPIPPLQPRTLQEAVMLLTLADRLSDAGVRVAEELARLTNGADQEEREIDPLRPANPVTSVQQLLRLIGKAKRMNPFLSGPVSPVIDADRKERRESEEPGTGEGLGPTGKKKPGDDEAA